MVSEKPWKPEAVAWLLAGIFLSLSLGALLGGIVGRFENSIPRDQVEFYGTVVSTVVFQLGSLVCIGVFLRMQRLTVGEAFGIRIGGLGWVLLWGVGTAVVALPATLALNRLMFHLLEAIQVQPVQQTTVTVLRTSISLGHQVYLGIVTVILAPVIEELLFRGVLYSSLKQMRLTGVARWLRKALYPRLVWRGHRRLAARERAASHRIGTRGSVLLALVMSSVLFGIIHLNLMTLVPLTVLAMLLAILYEKTGNLLAPIIAHSLFNLVNFVALLLQTRSDMVVPPV
jgi:membrane protease YdiL (CAAX protease family)